MRNEAYLVLYAAMTNAETTKQTGLFQQPAEPAVRRGHNGPAFIYPDMLKYKVVEVSTVTDEELEAAINATVAEGWNFDGINFAMRDASRRPSMAFIIFTRQAPE